MDIKKDPLSVPQLFPRGKQSLFPSANHLEPLAVSEKVHCKIVLGASEDEIIAHP